MSHVVLHLLNLADKTNEVCRHCRKEVYQGAVNLLHFLLNSDNSLLELLAKGLSSSFNTSGPDKQLLRRDIGDLFRLQLDIVVGAALVDNFNVRVLVLHNFIFDRGIVAVLRIVLDLPVDLGVLGEHFAHQELLGKGECFNLCRSDVHKLSLCVVAQVVIAKEGV